MNRFGFVFTFVILSTLLPIGSAHAVYDAGTGRWLTRDPLGGRAGTNQYRYMDASPLVGSDPSGLLPYAPPIDRDDVPWLPINWDPDTNAIYGGICGHVQFGKVTACTLDISFEGNCAGEESLFRLWRLLNDPCKYLTKQIEYREFDWSKVCPLGQTCQTVHYQDEYAFDVGIIFPYSPTCNVIIHGWVQVWVYGEIGRCTSTPCSESPSSPALSPSPVVQRTSRLSPLMEHL